MLWKLFNPCGKFPNNLEIVQTIYLSPYMSFKWFIINRLMWNKIFLKGSNSANMPAWFFCPSFISLNTLLKRGGGLPLPLGSPVSENWFSAWPKPLGATTCESLEQPEVGSHNNGPPTSQVSLSLFWKLQSAVKLG